MCFLTVLQISSVCQYLHSTDPIHIVSLYVSLGPDVHSQLLILTLCLRCRLQTPPRAKRIVIQPEPYSHGLNSGTRTVQILSPARCKRYHLYDPLARSIQFYSHGPRYHLCNPNSIYSKRATPRHLPPPIYFLPTAHPPGYSKI